jgi:ABC-type glycerol-3-phosphate transport system substrate-binding protein
MKSMKRWIALGLSIMMGLAAVGCGGNAAPSAGTAENTPASESAAPAPAPVASTTWPRDINIGTWWLQYYDSSHTAVEDDPSYSGTLAAELKLENVRKIEEETGAKFYWQNLTYEGVKESINNSILAGSPDCDIYLVELSFGIPAALNGLALDLKTVLPEDSDIFNDQTVAKYLDLGDGKASLIKRVEAASTVEATYPLGFNKQMLDNNNLEDPRDLYARGEWTWDKFIEYCQALTQDTDGDGQVDQYGFCGFINDTFEQLLMSNGAHVATGTTEELSSASTGETLQMVSDMFNTYKVCYPYDMEAEDHAATMRFQYTQGNIGFFPIAAWIAGEKADYDVNGANGTTLAFDTIYVQWPVGPSGDAATNAGKVSAGEYYIIPAGVDDPEQVFGVLYDMWNWYDGDTTLRDDPEANAWWYGVTGKTEEIQNHNFDIMFEVGSRETFELWNNLGVEYDFKPLIGGSMTPAQFQETYKQQVQDALDAYFK